MSKEVGYPAVHISDVDYWQLIDTKTKPLLVSIRGTNGSGKTTIPMSMMKDPKMFVLTWFRDKKVRPFATVFPSYNCIAMGTYFNKTGGMDTYKDNKMIRDGLELLWSSPYNIIMEGAVASTIFSTYGNLYREYLDRPDLRDREVIFTVLTPPIEECLKRIQERNGGQEINSARVTSHWRSILKNANYWESYGFTCISLDNTGISVEDTLDWYNEEVYKTIGKRVAVFED